MQDAAATVFLNDRRVGVLGFHGGNTWFDYTDLAPDHPVLGQGFQRDPRKRRTASGSVPEWFSNLLPEPGSGLRRLVATELGRTSVHDFLLLTHLGEDLPGAVRVIVDGDLSAIPELRDAEECTHDHPLRFSLAGAQPKFSMAEDGKAMVLPATGQGGDWIVKLPDRRFPEVPANEFAMLEWARLAGIEVPPCRLVPASELHGLPRGLVKSGEYALAVRRFDRTEAGRVHQEDFAQVREVSADTKYDRASYAGVGRVVRAVCPPDDYPEYIRRLAAAVVMGNLDAHLKNWTLRYPDGRQARLSPAYDLVSVTSYPEFTEDRLAFALGGTHSTRLIGTENFHLLAEALHADPKRTAAIAVETAAAMAASWPEVKRNLPVPEFVTEHIEERLEGLPLLRG
ncbi:type II toxin-antitoxin system HipA family toxin [Streptomyces sp. NPDC092296]|uniref:type II toxin-antitoxin system HipA family toxin n=1 Tax=Streptomyces sp. NPDC092296 TaxID=3366012 RepID=UPI0037F8097D